MTFLSKLFGRRAAGSGGQGTAMQREKEPGKESYKEKDNMGTRHDTIQIATGYWISRMTQVRKDPFAMYVFDNGNDARDALLELPCIQTAEDTGNLICTEILIFGYYRREDEKYEAIICGDELTHELWEQAKESFQRHGGVLKNDLEPELRAAAAAPKAEAGDASKVVYVREDYQQQMGQTMTYRIHKAPDAASAKAFLEKNPVNRQFYYIVVETPEGNYCRDIQGVYKE